MSERRHHEDRRQRGLRIVPTELPAPLEEAPFLRPNRRTRVRRARRGWMGRSILLLEATGGVFIVASALWVSYSRVMASERLRSSRLSDETSDAWPLATIPVTPRVSASQRRWRRYAGSSIARSDVNGSTLAGMTPEKRSGSFIATSPMQRDYHLEI